MKLMQHFRMSPSMCANVLTKIVDLGVKDQEKERPTECGILIHFVLSFVVLMLVHGLGLAQSKESNHVWPDNIIITKRLVGESKIDKNRAVSWEAATAYVCSQMGKQYEQGMLTKLYEGDIVIKESIYLSGRKRIVITEYLMDVGNEGSDCVARLRPAVRYDYSAPGAGWTVIQSPKGPYSPERSGRDNSLVMQIQERQFQNRLKNFQRKWRAKKYDDVEEHFGHRCGYPPNPANLQRPKGMGGYGDLYDQAVAAAQQFHQEGTKLCSLIGSPEHVGTGEKLVLHIKEPKRNYDEKTGCFDFEVADNLLKRKCLPIVVDFRVNAAMPSEIFEKPDWAHGDVKKPANEKSSVHRETVDRNKIKGSK